MSTPFVELQKRVITLLQRWNAADNKNLTRFAELYCIKGAPFSALTEEDLILLDKCGIPASEWEDYFEPESFSRHLFEIISEQIDIDHGLENLTIRNLLGSPLSHREPVSFEQYIAHRGGGVNALKTSLCSMPRVLRVGDVLATGETVTAPPREGGNGEVLIRLGRKDGNHDIWIGYPARTALALIAVAGNPPPEGLIE